MQRRKFLLSGLVATMASLIASKTQAYSSNIVPEWMDPETGKNWNGDIVLPDDNRDENILRCYTLPHEDILDLSDITHQHTADGLVFLGMLVHNDQERRIREGYRQRFCNFIKELKEKNIIEAYLCVPLYMELVGIDVRDGRPIISTSGRRAFISPPSEEDEAFICPEEFRRNRYGLYFYFKPTKGWTREKLNKSFSIFSGRDKFILEGELPNEW